MGRALLVLRLVVADVRRHPVPAAMLLLSITVATVVLSLGAALHGATGRLYEQTRAATAGPDIVAVAPGDDRATTDLLTSLVDRPEVVAHGGPYRRFFTELSVGGATAGAVVHDVPDPARPIDRPKVTSGSWLRPGGVVVERGFADALGIRVGDRVTVGGRSFPVVGVAVTAAAMVYPWAGMGGPDGGVVSDRVGLFWLGSADTRALAATDAPVVSQLYLRLRDPAATEEFRLATRPYRRVDGVTVNLFRWQVIADRDATLLRDSQPILVIGSWLLGFLAVAGITTLAAGRAAGQTRRVGLLKAVGAPPGLVAAVLFAEYVTLALVAGALGLAVAAVAAPLVVNPSGSLLSATGGPSGAVVVMTLVVALFLATVSTLGPTVRALRTETVDALADAARRPRYPGALTRISAWLPTPLLLGLRLVARRPGRAVLHACGTAATTAAVCILVMVRSQTGEGWDFGATTLPDLRYEQAKHLLATVAVALIALAVVNTLTITWTTALESRASMAVAQTFGATPGQVTAGLAAAQVLPALPGALAGVPLGTGLLWLFGNGDAHWPPLWTLFAIPLSVVAATALVTALPARLGATHPIPRSLSTGG